MEVVRRRRNEAPSVGRLGQQTEKNRQRPSASSALAASFSGSSSSTDPLISAGPVSSGGYNDRGDEAAALEAGRTDGVGGKVDIPAFGPASAAVERNTGSLRKVHRSNKPKHATLATTMTTTADLEEGRDDVATPAAGEFVDVRMNPLAESYERGRWLLGLLVLQSTSSFVLDKYQDLLRDHVVVTLFLTMLVGAGGNAGNQSAIKVIRGLATGRFTADAPCALRVVGQESLVGLLLGTALSAGGFVRVWVTAGTTARDATAISLSLFLIVMTSVLLGSALPFGFARAGVDPAHAGTSIQVAMDIFGVAITCLTCSAILTQLDQALAVPVGAL